MTYWQSLVRRKKLSILSILTINMNNNNKKKKNNNNKKQKNRQLPVNTSIMRNPYPVFAPEHINITFIYNDTSLVRNNAGSSYLWFKMRTSLYDPDPLLLTGGITGFLEWGGIYRKYLIEAVTIEWRVCNLETFPVSITFAPSLNDLILAVTSRNAAADLGELKISQNRALSMAGGLDRTIIKARINLPQYIGNSIEFYAGGYSGFMGALPGNPALLVFFNFAAYAANVFVNGIESTLRIKFHTRLYDLQSPIDRV